MLGCSDTSPGCSWGKMQLRSLGVMLRVSVADAESRALAKERQKKDNHNLSELGAGCPWVACLSLSHPAALFPSLFILIPPLSKPGPPSHPTSLSGNTTPAAPLSWLPLSQLCKVPTVQDRPRCPSR